MFLAAMVSARYASWLGAAVPAVIVYVLGVAWEWDPDAIPLVIAAGVVGGLGFLAGLVRRGRRRRRVREGLV